MQKIPQVQRTLLSLVSAKTLSHFGTSFRGNSILQCHSLETLKAQMMRNPRVLILAEFAKCTSRHVDAFLSLKSQMKPDKRPQMKIIIYAKAIDSSVHRKFSRHPDVLLIEEADALKAPYLTTKFLHGDAVIMRSLPRQQMSSPVLVKSTTWVQTKEDLPQRKGRFLDFTKLGARLYLPQRLYKTKDYISVLYQLENHEWVTVECQLRWEAPTADGGQMLGVQFLAIA